MFESIFKIVIILKINSDSNLDINFALTIFPHLGVPNFLNTNILDPNLSAR